MVTFCFLPPPNFQIYAPCPKSKSTSFNFKILKQREDAAKIGKLCLIPDNQSKKCLKCLKFKFHQIVGSRQVNNAVSTCKRNCTGTIKHVNVQINKQLQ